MDRSTSAGDGRVASDAGVPSARAAASALRELDAAQLAVVRILPAPLATQLIQLMPTLGAGFYGVAAFGPDDRTHDVGFALGAAFYLSGALGSTAIAGLQRRSGITSTALRFRRTGSAGQVSVFAALILAGMISVVSTGDGWVGTPFVAAAVAVQGWLYAQQRAAQPRRLTPLQWRAKPETFYREFLDPDVLRVAAALALVNAARPMAIAAALGLDASEMAAAVDTLGRLGYIDWKSKDDGRGRRASLNYHGRRAYRHHLGALEQAAGALPKAALQAA